MSERDWLRLPVVLTGAEYLVLGHLMRQNILTYKEPEGNEGYDLICIHPEPGYGVKSVVGEFLPLPASRSVCLRTASPYLRTKLSTTDLSPVFCALKADACSPAPGGRLNQ